MRQGICVTAQLGGIARSRTEIDTAVEVAKIPVGRFGRTSAVAIRSPCPFILMYVMYNSAQNVPGGMG